MTKQINTHREFNDTGLCVPHMHYMAHRSGKVEELVKLVEKGKYFTINRPRQYGKTTLLYLLEKELEQMDYLVLRISFEGVGDKVFSGEDLFAPAFIKMLYKKLKPAQQKLSQFFISQEENISSLHDLSDVITEAVVIAGKKTVLQIDEVDKSSNNQLFLSFLGMLRAKYLARNEGTDSTFHSVILAGVHDVKNLKIKIGVEDEKKYNSPWNIAVDLKIDLSLTTGEIESLLFDFLSENKARINTSIFVDKLYYYTSGHPFLVSRLCKIIHEDIRPNSEWLVSDLDTAAGMLVKEDNTNFESVTKNLENNPDLYEFVFKIIMNDQEFSFNPRNAIIRLGNIYGLIDRDNGRVKIHNRIYEQLIYDYMASSLETSGGLKFESVGTNYLTPDGTLDLKKVIRKFQAFMEEQYSRKDEAFIERNGRLLFLAFIKPIINGKGFDFKEVQISREKRLDVVITFNNIKYIIELKIWRGEAYHRQGIQQLCDYLDLQTQTTGYLLIYDLRKEKKQSGQWEQLELTGKTIHIAWV